MFFVDLTYLHKNVHSSHKITIVIGRPYAIKMANAINTLFNKVFQVETTKANHESLVKADSALCFLDCSGLKEEKRKEC